MKIEFIRISQIKLPKKIIIINKINFNKVKTNNNPTTMIKCKFSNAVHKVLEPNIEVKSRDRWKYRKEFTDKQKLEIFDEIMKLHKECSNELTSYLYDRREKKRIHNDRVKRGYNFKKKTKKEDYEKSLAVSK